MKGLLCKLHNLKNKAKSLHLFSFSPLLLLGSLTLALVLSFLNSPLASATSLNPNPSYIWATYRNNTNPADSFVNKEMCNSQGSCSNPFALLGNNNYDVYGLVVDTPLSFSTLSYGSAKYIMYIWSGGNNLGGDHWGDTTEQYSEFFDSTMSGTLRDGSAVTVQGVCSRTWQDPHQIKLECNYLNLPANTTFNITTVRFGHSSLSTDNRPIFENRPALGGGIIYTSNYEFIYTTSNSPEAGYLQEITNQNQTIINQNNTIINNQQATTDAIQEQNDRDQEDRDNLEQQSQDGQDAAEDAGAEAEAQGQSLMYTIISFVNAVTNAQPTNCLIRFDIPVHNTHFRDPNNLDIDICQFNVPSAISVVGLVLVAIFMLVSSISLVNAFLALYNEISGGNK